MGKLVADTVSKKKRSEMMALVRNKNTKPELLVRKLVFSMGYRYRLHRSDIPGKPDLVFAGRKKVIFVHGCFWHRHDCPRGTMPKTNKTFWSKKLSKNVERDRKVQAELKEMSWDFLVIWECDLKHIPHLKKMLQDFLIH